MRLSPIAIALKALAILVVFTLAMSGCGDGVTSPAALPPPDEQPPAELGVTVPVADLLDALADELEALTDAGLEETAVRKLEERLETAVREWEKGEERKAARELLKLRGELRKLVREGKLGADAAGPALEASARAVEEVLAELGWEEEAEAVLEVDAEVELLVEQGILAAKDGKQLLKRIRKALETLAKDEPERAANELEKLLKEVEKIIEKGELSRDAAADLTGAADRAIALLRGELPPVFTGAPGAPVASVIEDVDFTPRQEDYSTDHPDLPGIRISFNTLALVFAPAVTVAEANELLREMEAELVGAIAGVGEPGILILRVPTSSHEQMEALLEELRSDPRVEDAVQDLFDEPALLPGPNGGNPAGWTWEAVPSGGNWGLELSRVPQMWNLYPGAAKPGFPSLLTGVVDAGFETSHPDLVYRRNLDRGDEHDHGTHVVGIIGAALGGRGVDGVNPFAIANLVVTAPALSVAKVVQTVKTLVRDHQVRVLNTSLAFNWYKQGISADLSAPAQGKARQWGKLVAKTLSSLEAQGKFPLWLTAAGNDSDSGLGVQSAAFASAYANAALEQGADGILVVEAVGLDPGAPGNASRASFSNVQGEVSAPGVDILSTVTGPTLYAEMSGTSMATPFVAGLAGFLLALEPDLPRAELVRLLLENTVPVGDGASPRVDAFAAAMAVDQVSGIHGDPVRRMLLDIDDGTSDGNRRVNRDGSRNTEEDADGDGGSGDGFINMADFRRFRDWLLQTEGAPELDLDGAPDHPKKDLNRDGRVEAAADENLHPRADFNGDGGLSRRAVAFVPGLPGPSTDLKVLRSLFDDPHYGEADLPGLLDSFDLAVDAASCRGIPEAVTASSTVRSVGGGTVEDDRRHGPGGSLQIYTLPWGREYSVRLEALDADGGVLGSVEETFGPLGPGADVLWAPETCEGCARLTRGLIGSSGTGFTPVIVPNAPTSVEPGRWELNNARAFPERRGVALDADLPVDGTVDSDSRLRINQNNPPPGGSIPAGTVVNSYLIHVDPVGTSFTDAFGTVYFDERILGAQVLSATLDAGDAVLGSETTAYPTGVGTRGKELHGSVLRFGLFFSPAPGLGLSNIRRSGWPGGAVAGASFNTVVPSPTVPGEAMDQMRIITLAECAGGG